MGRYVFKLPDVGEGTAEAEIVGWHVKVGDKVSEDQPLVDVMTDKATVEITSPVDGVVTSITGNPGDMAAVGSTLVIFEVEGAGNAAAETAPAPAVPAAAGEEPLPHVPAPVEAVTPQPDMQGEGNYVFKLPDVGEGTAEAEIVAWHVKPGDHVEEDQPLADVMTDKATVELTSPVAGRVVATHGNVGEMAAVGSGIVVLEVEGAGNVARGAAPKPAAAPAPAAAPKAEAKPAPKAEAPKPAAAPAPKAAAAEAFSTRVAGERPLASPAVRKRARDLGIELQFVPGSGPAGRIEHADLDAYVASGGRKATAIGSGHGAPRYAERTGVEEIKVIGLRRKIAEKMQEAKRRIPHFMYAEEIDVTELEALRVYMNATKQKDQPKLSFLPFFARALVKVLPQHPQINARYDDDAGVLHRFDGVHLGIATQTPNGLMVPVVRHAEALDVWATATEIARVATAAKDGKAAREELSGSTITITSLGTLGGIVHTPVINHPEVAIVGPNKIVERPVVKNGQVVVRKMMNLSSSFDHRIVDGYDAAEFVQKIKGLLEHPAALFVD
ncbi:2-oxo acid dehydrogenase subunit E2 [Caulobacter sp. 17J80-11]|uniref:2-oxo acid dehydrogenase subunit E2 n=1 Tax=Caulobacter sp. 17J80-11 TaxID=2763502 RepID=UPI0016539AF5|nr:2-oxo acid dehydrogenase subunit E2 [Caulobacter sp. 17J80-11]MBC6983525.1 2-oxo acid dehydrogenase subunit E2 [Caulobacter sp. 17J80-11]